MRRTFIRLTWLAVGVLLTVLFLEAVLRLLPVSMGRYRTDQFARWPLQNLEPRLPHAYSISWAMLNAQRGVTNNYGHTAPIDYHKGSHPVLVRRVIIWPCRGWRGMSSTRSPRFS